MLTYKIQECCHGYSTAYYEIHVLFDGVTIGCIYYLEDALKSSIPYVQFDKWLKYKNYQIPDINPIKVAEYIILEHYLLQ